MSRQRRRQQDLCSGSPPTTQAVLARTQPPRDANALGRLADACFNQQRFAEAATHYEELARRQPNVATYRLNWGAALAQLGRRDAAVKRFREALQLQPDLAE